MSTCPLKGAIRLTLVLLGMAILATACGSPAAIPSPAVATEPTALKLAPASALPSEMRKLSPEIQEAYRFAIANPDILEEIPCYCGCRRLGHTSNHSCYVQSESAAERPADFPRDGKIVLDYHGSV